MAFFQNPPRLENQFDGDPLLREYLARLFPGGTPGPLKSELRELAHRAATELWEDSIRERTIEPTLTSYGPWGNRVDQVELTPLWKKAHAISAQHGLVATGYAEEFSWRCRAVQHLKNYIVQPSLDFFSCPLAMTDGAAHTLIESKNTSLLERAVPRLLSLDPGKMWTSGQWMTERAGGSDVSGTETVAKHEHGSDYRLYGTKWFTSAVSADMSLTLARPVGNPAGSSGLALFYLETRDENNQLNGIQINRLKDKLGTRKVPTAELTLEGTRAVPVAGLDQGVRAITPMLRITRCWNSVVSAALARRAVSACL